MTTALASPPREACERFECFGGECVVLVQGSGAAGTAPLAAQRAKRRLLDWHGQFSRFEADSELSLLNRDPHERVPASGMMVRFVGAALEAAGATEGLVDPTLLNQIEDAGYTQSLLTDAVPLGEALRRAPTRRPARPRQATDWRSVRVEQGAVIRPPGVGIDSGGIAKGLFGDVLAAVLGTHSSYAIDAAGDVRVGGTAGALRPVQVTSPFDGSVIHTFGLARGAAATSGIGKRSWLDEEGAPAHHLLNPATGSPAFTGIVQVTARAPTGVQAETLAKAALLSGVRSARDWLSCGGLVVYDSGEHELVAPSDSFVR